MRNEPCASAKAVALMVLVAALASAATDTTCLAADPGAPEPNMEQAFTWWSEIPDIWTPIGWKDHLFRYNVLWNGTLVAYPFLNARTEKWIHQGAQFTFHPASGFAIPYIGSLPMNSPPRDDNSVLQGWYDRAAPVLWSEWASSALLLRQDVFTHIPGGGDIQTGIEPLFAWVRLKVHDTCETARVHDRYGFVIKINAPHVSDQWMAIRNSALLHPELSLYPRELKPEKDAYDRGTGYRLLEPEGNVRLAVAPGQDCLVQFRAGYPTDKDSCIYVEFAARKGAHVDLLVPMLPTPRDVMDSELALGYERALAQTERYWARKPATAAEFVVPEEHITRAIGHALREAEMIAERDPATGIYSILSGSWMYAALWATPSSMVFTMELDPMGYHSVAAKYLEMFKSEQGTVKPPGDHFKLHPGYLSTPKSLTSIDWLTDHGAILTAICEHALLSGDGKFIEEWTPAIVKACEWIKYARGIKGHGGVEGIMPSGVHTDAGAQRQAIWTDGWTYKGLSTAVRLLRMIHHPRAGEFEAEAREYREAFGEALRAKTKTMPTWTDDKGKAHHIVPIAISGEAPYENGIDFTYLDAGPLMLVYSGLMDASDDLMRSTLQWFREGPPRKFYRYDSNNFLMASLQHEVSSSELCYSWNVFHSWQSGDRARFLEGMYSLFAANRSRETYMACEARGGNHGTTFGSLPLCLARLAVVDDRIRDDELHLMRFMPLAWLRTDFESKFLKMATYYGPVSLRARLSRGGRHLQVFWSEQFRTPPKKLVLHIPPVKGLRTITVNGKPLKWDGKAASVLLPMQAR